MKFSKIYAAALGCILAAIFSGCNGADDAIYKDLPFAMEKVQAPRIPSRSVVLTDFLPAAQKAGGAAAEASQQASASAAESAGSALCTEAFAEAIDALSAQGGGRLIVPAGIWRTGPIGLKSKIELHLEKNAIIVFDHNQDLYPIIDTNFEGLDVRRCLSPIHAESATDIAITGEGIIDGSGEYWRELKKEKVGDKFWKTVLKRGGVLADDGSVWYPDEGYKKARLTAGSLNYPDPSLDENEIKTFLRPVLVSFRNCERILLHGCTFQNSPCWNIHPLFCKDLIIKDITVRNPEFSTNGDGIDIDACEGVLLTGSSFDVGDDAICIKSGKDADGRRHARKCRNLIIKDCTVYHGHGGFVVGSEMSGGVENILVDGCRFLGTDVGLRFKSTRGRGGLVKDIWCRDIYMKDIVSYGVIFNLYYAGVAASEKAAGKAASTGVAASEKAAAQEAPTDALPPVDETTPEMRDIHFDRIFCSGAKQAIYLNGLPELPLSGLSFSNCFFSAGKGVDIHHARGIVFDKVWVNERILTGEWEVNDGV